MKFQVVRGTTPGRPFFWRIVGDEGDVLTDSSATYPTRAACLRAIGAVMRGAADAEVEDLSDEF